MIHTRLFPTCVLRSKSVNERNYYGGSALIVATLHNHTEILQYLLRKKADVNAKTNKGYSSLHVAAKHGFTAATQILLDKGERSPSGSRGTMQPAPVMHP